MRAREGCRWRRQGLDGNPAGGNQSSARRAVAALEPETSELMAARRAYAAGMMLTQTRGQTIPAGAVLDGTI